MVGIRYTAILAAAIRVSQFVAFASLGSVVDAKSLVDQRIAGADEAALTAERLSIDEPVQISPSGSGGHFWLFGNSASDPTNPRELVTCGIRAHQSPARWDIYLYRSSDGGVSWRTAFIDDRPSDSGLPQLISEPSCAFGPDGMVALNSSGWGNFFGKAFRLLTSYDGGSNWRHDISRKGFAEATQMAINRSPSAEPEIYMFGTISPHSQEITDGLIASPLLTSLDGGKTVKPAANPKSLYTPDVISWPSKAVISTTGSAHAIYLARSAGKELGTDISIELVSTRDRGKTVSRRPIVSWKNKVHFSTPTSGGAYRAIAGLAVDRSESRYRGRMYAAWSQPHPTENRYELILSSSDDDGLTWQNTVRIDTSGKRRLSSEAYPGFDIANPAIAIDSIGQIGLLWSEHDGKCRRFAASGDGGLTFTTSIAVAGCALSGSNEIKRDYLAAFDAPYEMNNGVPTAVRHDQIGFVIDASNWEYEAALFATDAGRFNIVYNQPSDGSLWSSGVRLRPQPLVSDLSLKGLILADNEFKVAVDRFSYDSDNLILTVDLKLIRTSFPSSANGSYTSPIALRAQNLTRSPRNAKLTSRILMVLSSMNSSGGSLSVVYPATKGSDGKPVIDLTHLFPADRSDRSVSDPFRVILKLSSAPQVTGALVNVQGHVFVEPSD